MRTSRSQTPNEWCAVMCISSVLHSRFRPLSKHSLLQCLILFLVVHNCQQSLQTNALRWYPTQRQWCQLALDSDGLLVGAVAVLRTSFPYTWRDHSIAGAAQINGARCRWIVRFHIINGIIVIIDLPLSRQGWINRSDHRHLSAHEFELVWGLCTITLGA